MSHQDQDANMPEVNHTLVSRHQMHLTHSLTIIQIIAIHSVSISTHTKGQPCEQITDVMFREVCSRQTINPWHQILIVVLTGAFVTRSPPSAQFPWSARCAFCSQISLLGLQKTIHFWTIYVLDSLINMMKSTFGRWMPKHNGWILVGPWHCVSMLWYTVKSWNS